MVETWLRWLKYVERKFIDHVVKKIDHMNGNQINHLRQRKTYKTIKEIVKKVP